MNRVPAIPASIAAIVTLSGLALVYWSLTGLGLLRSGPAPKAAEVVTDSSGGRAIGGTW